MTSSVRRLAVLSAILPLFAVVDSSTLVAQTTAKRALRVGDMYRLRNVGAPEISPDGQWVAYTVTSLDSAKDKSNTDVWMASWDGTQVIQLTSSPDAETSPRWSPDGKYLSFLSSREGGKGSQLWLLDRRGGEAQRVSELKDGIDDYAWAPDSKRIALIMRASLDTADSAASKPKPKPIVIDRYHFKDDNGYPTRPARTSMSSTSPTRKRRGHAGMLEERVRPGRPTENRSPSSARVRRSDLDRTNNLTSSSSSAGRAMPSVSPRSKDPTTALSGVRRPVARVSARQRAQVLRVQ
jgi:Tol biopolymer transport system component